MRFLLFVLFISCACAGFSQNSPRQHASLDANWRFHLGHAASPEKDFNFGIANLFAKSGAGHNTPVNPDFKDSDWEELDLPHDWALKLPVVYSPNFDVMAHGYKAIGGLFPENSIGWYRKHFRVNPADSAMRFQVQFDGVFRDAQFWLNGFYLGRNTSGYVGCSFDVTNYLRFQGDNVLVVRADATQYEGWFYEGAGIYRHVWLNRYADQHFAEDGIFAWSEPMGDQAEIQIEAEILNENAASANASIITQLIDRKGLAIAQASAPVLLEAHGNFRQKLRFRFKNPHLWFLDDPYLYHLVVELKNGAQVIDRQTLRLGVRKIEILADGLRLNGEKIKIKGVNCHQDHAGLGSALPDYMQYYRISLLKNMGVNAYRSSHHAPTPELLDACDSLGMLVLDEHRLLNSSPEYLNQLERLVRRDRSRTCVFLWSIGNEEGWIQATPTGKRIAKTLLEKLNKLDPTRTATYAADLPNVFEGVNAVIPVRGFNYRHQAVADYHRDHPKQPIIGTEMGSTVTTRGIYEKDTLRAYVPDQDISYPWWASRAEDWWTLAAEHDYWLGGFVWTGLDYRGEPTPYQYPNTSSHFGLMDLCGFPKNLYYYYQSWWSDKEVLHLSPHWNWRNKQGQPVDVWVNSNADSIQLLLNGRSLGFQVMPRNRHLQWSVPFEAGRLEAIGFKNGKKIHAIQESTGLPFEVVLTPSKTTLIANGSDVTVLNISVVDDQGRPIPDADNLISFTIHGNARFIGVGNGNPSSHEPDICPEGVWERHLFNGKCQIIVQAGIQPDVVHIEAQAKGLWSGATDLVTISPAQTISSPNAKYVIPESVKRPRSVEPMIGADISFLPEIEACNKYFTDQGVKKDPIDLLKIHGFNYIRLRIFHNPKTEKGYSPKSGFCDLAHTVQMAKRVKAAGLKLLLDFHYSDYWADPGKQYKPAAWEGHTFEQMCDDLYKYTREVMQALQAQGALPDMVQIGNEINHGMVWPEGSVQHLDSLAQLLIAGSSAVLSVSPDVRLLLHVALGGQNHESVFFIEQMAHRKVPFDAIGLSYYPKWHGTLDDLRDNLSDLERRFDRDLIVVEYSQEKEAVHRITFGLPGGHGKGTCIWEPLNTWEALFDQDGNATPWLGTYDNWAKMYLNGKK